MPKRTLKSPRNSSASTCAPSTCCRRNPWNPSFPNTSASSWNGPVRTIPPNSSLTDLKTHPVYNLEEQLALFDTSKGMSTAQKWQSDIAKFFASVGSINKDELKKVENGAYATDKYLKLVKTPIPSYK